MLGYFGGNELQTRSVWLYIKTRTVSLYIISLKYNRDAAFPTIPCMKLKTRIPYITISIAVAKIKNKTNKKKKKEWKNFLLLVSETINVYSRSVVSYV